MLKLFCNKNVKEKGTKIYLGGIILLFIIKAVVLYFNWPIKKGDITLIASLLISAFTIFVMLFGTPNDTEGEVKFYDSLWGVSTAAGFVVASCIFLEILGIISNFTKLGEGYNINLPMIVTAIDASSFSFWVALTKNSKETFESFKISK